MNVTDSKAVAEVVSSEAGVTLRVGGAWRLTEQLPHPDHVIPQQINGSEIRVVGEGLTEWDSSLPLFLLHLRTWCRAHDATLNLEALPDALKRLFELISESEENLPAPRPGPSLSHPVIEVGRRAFSELTGFLRFVGECCLGGVDSVRNLRRFRWKDFFIEMVQAGPKALPIVGLLSFLIGVTFAFETASQLRQFGAQIYVVDGVGIAVVRQIGPIIAAVVLAGRTGAAYAAHIGNMKLGGEIDALETLSVSPINFLVIPRLAALFLMMPLITLYSDLLGILGGMIVTLTMMPITVTEFWLKIQSSLTLTDVNVGLLKSVVFGVLIGLAGTLRGMQCERSSAGVGRAATSAVVTGIMAIIVADALFAPILDKLGL